MIAALDGQALAGLGDHLIDEHQQPPGLWRELVERTAQGFMRQRIRCRDVVDGGFDVLHCLAVMTDALRGSLVLMQERDASDQREVLEMISAGSGLVIEEGKLTSEGISDVHRAQESLRIAMHGQNVVAIATRQQAFERLPLALQTMNGPRLFAVLIDG